jgi:hypothetical protein
MPIGSSKLGVLGAGLVPGGTETFNAPGTFSIPPGVKKVSITGIGGTGNPGTSGTGGNSGNLGVGGGGGGGGLIGNCATILPGGLAYVGINGNFSGATTGAGNTNPLIPGPTTGANGNPGSTGVGGQAGNVGSCGCAGNPGQCSSGLGNNFAGGAGGNAGAAGNAGNAGSGGQGGQGGGYGNSIPNSPSVAGSGGNGGGSGALGTASIPIPPGQTTGGGGGGGGGAGATNDGFPALTNSVVQTNVVYSPGGTGGATSNYNVTVSPTNDRLNLANPTSVPNSTTGGFGGKGPGRAVNSNTKLQGARGGNSIGSPSNISPMCLRFPPTGWDSPYPINSAGVNAARSGGGGGAGGIQPNQGASCAGGHGGGGGGRGNAGNPGGGGGAGGCGVAGTPATFNCVPVTPGGTAPITVASPGGQIVISWNPQ